MNSKSMGIMYCLGLVFAQAKTGKIFGEHHELKNVIECAALYLHPPHKFCESHIKSNDAV